MEVGMQYVASFDPDELGAVLDAWRLPPNSAVLALVPEAEKQEVQKLQAACRKRDLNLVGAIFPLLIHDARFVAKGGWLARLQGASRCVLVEDLNDGKKSPGKKIADAITPALGPEPSTLLLLFDSLTQNQSTIMEELYLELSDAVRYVGACAGSESFQPMDCLFDSHRVVAGGALCMLMSRALPTVLMHDYVALDEPSVATAADGNRIESIDFRPAFDFYRDKMRELYGVELDHSNFYRYAVEFPLAIQQANGRLTVRMPHGVAEGGALLCVGEISTSALLVVAHAPDPKSSQTAIALAAKLTEREVARNMLLFYCAGRRMRLGRGSDEDLRRLLETAEAVSTTGGALTLGEVGSLDDVGYPRFHNGAFICVDWSSR